jgi:hypothetical protein
LKLYYHWRKLAGRFIRGEGMLREPDNTTYDFKDPKVTV